MTIQQNQSKLNIIKALITIAGFTKDRRGNYKTNRQSTSYRIKIKTINLSIEAKKAKTSYWHEIISQPITDIDMKTFSAFMLKFTNKPQTATQS